MADLFCYKMQRKSIVATRTTKPFTQRTIFAVN